MVYVADYTDNGHPRLAFGPDSDSLSNSVIKWPVASCQSLIDDHDVGCAACISVIKLTALKQRNVHGAKVVWKYPSKTDAWCFARAKWSSIDRQVTVRVTSANRQSIDSTNRLYAGQTGKPLR